MNWFERYGIVGAYFLIIITTWFIFHSNFTLLDDIKSNDKLITAIIAAFTFSFVPIGYILSVFSQWLYYIGLGDRQIHKEVIKYLNKAAKKKFDLSESDNEHTLEAKITSSFRLLGDPKKLQYLGEFGTKRWDVLALNSSIRLSTILSLIFIFLFKWYRDGRICFSTKEIFLLLFSLTLIFILWRSSNILRDQIIEVVRSIFKNINNIKAP